MYATLGAEKAVRICTADDERRVFDARFVSRLPAYHLGLEALVLGPTKVHPSEHLGPVLGVDPASAGVDVDDRVVVVALIGEHALELERAHGALETDDLIGDFVDELRIAFGHLDELAQVLGFTRGSLEREDRLFGGSALAHRPLSPLGVVPEA